MERKQKKVYYVFSPWLRMFHWIMVLCVLTLFFTGLYIGDPGFAGFAGESPTIQVANTFSMETIRRIHFMAGFILTASFVLRIYGAIRNPGDRLLPKFRQKLYWTGLVDTIKHYLFLPRKHETEYIRNSLARTTYFIVYILFAIIIATGFAMYVMVEPNSIFARFFVPINNAFGEYNVHLIHHYVAWCFIVFLVIHVYLSFRADVTEHNGELSSMISGYRVYEEDPADIGDLK